MPTAVVADDSKFMRALVRRVLERAGIEVVAEAANGEEAIEAVHRHRPDILVIDVNMPGLSGLEALKKLRGEGIATKFVVLTALDQPKIEEEAKALGAVFLAKPLSPAKLLEAVKSLVGEG